MGKFTVKTRFRDKETQEIHEVGSTIDLTKARASEIREKLGERALEAVPEIEQTSKKPKMKEPIKGKKTTKKASE